MSNPRPLRYQILDPAENHPVPGKPRHQRGPAAKLQQLTPHRRELGSRLRAARFRDGRNGRGKWSLRSVANAAGMNHSILSQVETGKRRLMADDLVRLADVLGEDRDSLLILAGYLHASVAPTTANLTDAEKQLLSAVRARPTLLPRLLELARTGG